jgi:hypothetical protein
LVYPIIENIHVLAIALLAGTVAIVDLRLLSAVNTVVDDTPAFRISTVHRTARLASNWLTIEIVKEGQESELINSKEYSMLASVRPEQRTRTRAGARRRTIWANFSPRCGRSPAF